MSEATTITIQHRVPRDDLAFGVVFARGLSVGESDEALAAELSRWVEARRQPLDDETDTRRKAARDILRNGVYKPTGRGKPASEYLLRAAAGEDFPRISGPVDANNLVSLRYMVPISVCDVALAQSERFELRLGAEDERYVFNATGQVLELRDLVCGCAVSGDESTPVITPIKDSMATKLRPESRDVLGVIYFPLVAGGEAVATEATGAFARWLACCGADTQVTEGLLLPGGELTL